LETKLQGRRRAALTTPSNARNTTTNPKLGSFIAEVAGGLASLNHKSNIAALMRIRFREAKQFDLILRRSDLLRLSSGMKRRMSAGKAADDRALNSAINAA
jgi:hypothetical protein